jgi:hypothetical protein
MSPTSVHVFKIEQTVFLKRGRRLQVVIVSMMRGGSCELAGRVVAGRVVGAEHKIGA